MLHGPLNSGLLLKEAGNEHSGATENELYLLGHFAPSHPGPSRQTEQLWREEARKS